MPTEALAPVTMPSLRDYQARAVEAVIAGTQGTVVLPTGGGKSRLALGALARLGTPTLILVGSRDLATQWREQIQDLLGLRPGLVAGGALDVAPITVALAQSLVRRSPAELDALLARFGLLAVDECLPADARVLVRDHGHMLIRDCVRSAQPVDVLSFNHDSGEAEFRRVVAASEKRVVRRFATITVDAGDRTWRLRVTADHPVYVEGRGYVPAHQVITGDVALAPSAPPVPIASPPDNAGTVARAIDRSGGPGGPCPQCGKVYRTGATLRRHLGAHADPDRDAATRQASSARMKARNPVHDPQVYERIVASVRARPKASFRHLTGGNGHPPTAPEQALLERLGPAWTWRLCVPTGRRQEGMPVHYKINVAHPVAKVAVEVDGESHRARAVRAADQRKTEWLEAHGWTVLRFWNKEVLADPDAIAKRIQEVAACLV